MEDGYGSSYNIMENKLMFGITALKSCPQTDAKLFAKNLTKSLLDCQNILLNTNSKL